MTRRELTFQGHIIDSYKNEGGHARKWATELQVGVPDLVCALPGWGTHLAEVKHVPDMKYGSARKNPMTTKQVSVAREYLNGGALVMLYVVVGEDARSSSLLIFHPLSTVIEWDDFTPGAKYVPGTKYPLRGALHHYNGT